MGYFQVTLYSTVSSFYIPTSYAFNLKLISYVYVTVLEKETKWVTYSPNEDTTAKSFQTNLFGYPSSASSSDTGVLQEYQGFGHEDG